MLMAGHIGGIIGMLAAIPAYTVIRVIAGNFFYDKKIVQRLMPDVRKPEPELPNLREPKPEKITES